MGDNWAGKYDYLKEKGVNVVYFPYGRGVSSSELKNRIHERYSSLKNAADNHFPNDVNVKSTSNEEKKYNGKG